MTDDEYQRRLEAYFARVRRELRHKAERNGIGTGRSSAQGGQTTQSDGHVAEQSARQTGHRP